MIYEQSNRMDAIIERHKERAASAMPIYYAAVTVAIFTILLVGIARYEAVLKLGAV